MKITIVLATVASLTNSDTPTNDTTSSHQGKIQPYTYTVKPWCLVFDREEQKVNDTKWHWCKGDHYSGGVKYNGMYITRKTDEHNKWTKEQDKRNAQKRLDKYTWTHIASDTEPATKKLACSDKLPTVLATKAGLLNAMYDSIWKEVNRDLGNA